MLVEDIEDRHFFRYFPGNLKWYYYRNDLAVSRKFYKSSNSTSRICSMYYLHKYVHVFIATLVLVAQYWQIQIVGDLIVGGDVMYHSDCISSMKKINSSNMDLENLQNIC